MISLIYLAVKLFHKFILLGDRSHHFCSNTHYFENRQKWYQYFRETFYITMNYNLCSSLCVCVCLPAFETHIHSNEYEYNGVENVCWLRMAALNLISSFDLFVSALRVNFGKRIFRSVCQCAWKETMSSATDDTLAWECVCMCALVFVGLI